MRVWPTAQRSLAETPSTAIRWFSKLAVSGLGTMLQAPPLQRMVRVLKARLPGTLWLPTAQASPAESDLTPSRWFWALTLGLGTMLQALPFQRSVRVRLPLLELVNPTAQALLAEVASTSRSSPPPDGSGLGEMLQLVPFQRSITGRRMGRVPVSARPTAQALPDERASTPPEDVVELGEVGAGDRRPGRRRGGRGERQQDGAEQDRPSGEAGAGPATGALG